MHSLTENALEETTTTEQEIAVVVPSSKESKIKKLEKTVESEVDLLLLDEGLDFASIKTILKLKPTVEEVKASLELAKRSSYASLGAWLHQCLKLKWWASKSKSKASEKEEAKAKLESLIDARKEKAIKLLKKYPKSFEIQDNCIMVTNGKSVGFHGYASDDIELFFEYLIQTKGER